MEELIKHFYEVCGGDREKINSVIEFLGLTNEQTRVPLILFLKSLNDPKLPPTTIRHITDALKTEMDLKFLSQVFMGVDAYRVDIYDAACAALKYKPRLNSLAQKYYELAGYDTTRRLHLLYRVIAHTNAKTIIPIKALVDCIAENPAFAGKHLSDAGVILVDIQVDDIGFLCSALSGTETLGCHAVLKAAEEALSYATSGHC